MDTLILRDTQLTDQSADLMMDLDAIAAIEGVSMRCRAQRSMAAITLGVPAVELQAQTHHRQVARQQVPARSARRPRPPVRIPRSRRRARAPRRRVVRVVRVTARAGGGGGGDGGDGSDGDGSDHLTGPLLVGGGQ